MLYKTKRYGKNISLNFFIKLFLVVALYILFILICILAGDIKIEYIAMFDDFLLSFILRMHNNSLEFYVMDLSLLIFVFLCSVLINRHKQWTIIGFVHRTFSRFIRFINRITIGDLK